jgi:RNA polymerase sigma factor (TIGR02999 family)
MPPPPPADVTQLLEAHAAGDADATESLARVVYAELRELAAAVLRRERADHTWQPTELVHEAFLRLMGDAPPAWTGRTHFFGIAARVMRRLLVEHARARARHRRDGGVRVTLDEGLVGDGDADAAARTLDLWALDDALLRLADVDARAVRVVELRYFGGLALEEAAEVLGVSLATVKRDWSFARAFLRDALDQERATS